MKKFNSRSISLALTGVTTESILDKVDGLLKAHGIELVAVTTQDGLLVMTDSIVDEEIVMETAPTKILSQEERESFRPKSRIPG
ncbi:hypothetical protein DRQ53_08630 [bacterium]|nr:MAG: hypothetical protein DRQ53_08630 [bacterium]